MRESGNVRVLAFHYDPAEGPVCYESEATQQGGTIDHYQAPGARIWATKIKRIAYIDEGDYLRPA